MSKARGPQAFRDDISAFRFTPGAKPLKKANAGEDAGPNAARKNETIDHTKVIL
jgi:hypothetical protein